MVESKFRDSWCNIELHFGGRVFDGGYWELASG
jgi:hypothetical protein